MRKASYFKHQRGFLSKLFFVLHYAKYRKLGKKLDFSIGCDTLGYGAKITSKVKFGSNISIEANSLVNAKIIRQENAWYIRDSYEDRVKMIEKIDGKIWSIGIV